MKKTENLSPSKSLAAKTIFEAFKILKGEGSQLAGSEVINRIRNTVQFTDYEKAVYEKTGYIRWESILHFYTIGCVKAGYLRKDKGIWYLTEEGEKAMKLGPVELIESIDTAYAKWNFDKRSKSENGIPIPLQDVSQQAQTVDFVDQIQKANIEKLEDEAREGIINFLKNKGEYEFQDMVAALLRSMRYYTPFIAPRGKDGGIDIVAYQDPLGATTPRIKVQVKHRPDSSIAVDDIRSLKGLINRDNEIGLFVTSGRFTGEAERFTRETDVHIRLLKIQDFIQLWEDNYSKLKDEEKNMLPLHPIYFLGSNE
jgi:restriction system protein